MKLLTIVFAHLIAQNFVSCAFADKTTPSIKQTRPIVKFPDSFIIGISTNDLAINVTEVIYYDKKA